jgi:hypothetical protein
MAFPEFNENGDLPVGVYRATLWQVIEHFGRQNKRRRLIAQRLTRIYNLAKQTGYLARFIIFGSFVTSKPDPNDVDIFLLMDDAFDDKKMVGESAMIFNNLTTQQNEGASVFWLRRFAAIGGEQAAIEDWQYKRDETRRGIVEVVEND